MRASGSVDLGRLVMGLVCALPEPLGSLFVGLGHMANAQK